MIGQVVNKPSLGKTKSECTVNIHTFVFSYNDTNLGGYLII